MKSFATLPFLFLIPAALAHVVPSQYGGLGVPSQSGGLRVPSQSREAGQSLGKATKTHSHMAHATGGAAGQHTISAAESALINELIKSVYGGKGNGKDIEMEITVDKNGKQRIHTEKYHQEGRYKQHNGTHSAHTMKDAHGQSVKLLSNVHPSINHAKVPLPTKLPTHLKAVVSQVLGGSKSHSTHAPPMMHAAGGSGTHSSKTHSSKTHASKTHSSKSKATHASSTMA